MNNTNPNIVFNPLISTIQRVVLYETKTRLHLVGSNNRETRFRLLTIDRTQSDRLSISENPNELNAQEIRRFLSTLGSSPKIISAYGVLGFVRFLEAYYLILVTKRKCCAHIGMHLIYTIKDTVMVRVGEASAGIRTAHPYEERYKRMFQSIDLRSNFYFSYSYDLTRTLQYNESAPRYVGTSVNLEQDEPLPDWKSLTGNVAHSHESINFAFRSSARQRFVWNAFLLQPMADIMFKDWLLEITHGFVSQSCISIFGRYVNVCLIARRSTRFAGTRFLKRGANFQGDVANEVETEQIICDGRRMCSFTQMRGSVPSHWSQDISKMVPKPQIQLDICDPFAQTPSQHFERLLFHYGAPLIMLNLVKKREKRKHESIISKELVNSIQYLNQFISPQHRMRHIHFDMARKSRGGGNVMDMLADIAQNVVQQTGMFFRQPGEAITYQKGIVRTNCVDCLDRTNTAQFAIGKCALGYQLERLGYVKSPKLEFDSDCVTMLEHLYEEHGDTLALQYGGSQLVHRIKTYRKTAAWASQGNDIMQTLSRYYSNTFSDTEKQHSINLFLGYYIPSKSHAKNNEPIWELQTDYYMHNISKPLAESINHKLMTEWIRPIVRGTLPYPTSDSHKIVNELFRVHTKDLEMIDAYSNYHQSFKWTEMSEHIAFEISQLALRHMSTCRTNYSPFQRQVQDVRNRARQSASLSGKSSSSSFHSNSSSATSSSSSSSSSEAEDESSYEEVNACLSERIDGIENEEPSTNVNFETLLPPMETVYGCKISNANFENMSKYRKYVLMGKMCNANISLDKESPKSTRNAYQLTPLENYSQLSNFGKKPLTVDMKDKVTYEKHCQILNDFKFAQAIEINKDISHYLRYK